ncbi:MAG TPA: hypothetical protein VHO92_06500, partial [Methanobacterium sp.]|nr:hypothetical protein [Methanobacterium sp.]
CIDFAKEMGNKVANYLGCKSEDIQYYLYDKDGKPIEAHPRDALTLDNDTFWHYGMGINLYMAGDKNPSMPFILKMAIKGDKDGFIVEFPQLKKEFNIDPDKPEDFKPLNHLIFNAIKDRFENELEKFLKHRSVEHYPEYM